MLVDGGTHRAVQPNNYAMGIKMGMTNRREKGDGVGRVNRPQHPRETAVLVTMLIFGFHLHIPNYCLIGIFLWADNKSGGRL